VRANLTMWAWRGPISPLKGSLIKCMYFSATAHPHITSPMNTLDPTAPTYQVPVVSRGLQYTVGPATGYQPVQAERNVLTSPIKPLLPSATYQVPVAREGISEEGMCNATTYSGRLQIAPTVVNLTAAVANQVQAATTGTTITKRQVVISHPQLLAAIQHIQNQDTPAVLNQHLPNQIPAQQPQIYTDQAGNNLHAAELAFNSAPLDASIDDRMR